MKDESATGSASDVIFLLSYHVLSRIFFWQNLTSPGCRYLEFWDDGDCLDLLGPGELDVMTNADWRLRGPLAGIFSASRGREDFAEWDLDPGHIFRT